MYPRKVFQSGHRKKSELVPVSTQAAGSASLWLCVGRQVQSWTRVVCALFWCIKNSLPYYPLFLHPLMDPYPLLRCWLSSGHSLVKGESKEARLQSWQIIRKWCCDAAPSLQIVPQETRRLKCIDLSVYIIFMDWNSLKSREFFYSRSSKPPTSNHEDRKRQLFLI